jgi:predicted DNA-binding transcriptional regulator AlpA
MKSVISIEPEAPSMAHARPVASFGNDKPLYKPIQSVAPVGIGSRCASGNPVPINAAAKGRWPSIPDESSMPKILTQFAAVGPPPLPTPRLALSIPEFCKAYGISEGLFFKLKKQGEGPREMKVGARTLISLESAAEWGRARESKAKPRSS